MDATPDINANARTMLAILDDPTIYLVDSLGHAYTASSYNGAMYRNYASAMLAANSDAYGYLAQMRFGPKSAAHLDAQGVWMVMPPEAIRSGADLATTVVAQPASVPLPTQSQSASGGAVFGASAPAPAPAQNPVLPNNTPNPAPGSISPGASANAQDAHGGSTQVNSNSQDIWDMAINGSNGGNGANGADGAPGASGAGGIDPKLVMYGLVALVALLAVSK